MFTNTILKNQKEGKNYKYTVLMIDASRNINNIIARKITINNTLDNPEFYKDKDLIRFLRKNNPEDDEFYEYENEMIKDIRKNY